MKNLISKSQFKPQALEYLRLVEKSKKPLIITHFGKPVIKVEPYTAKPNAIAKLLSQSVIEYEDPTKPVDEKEWESLK